jgi:hypothetical protein
MFDGALREPAVDAGDDVIESCDCAGRMRNELVRVAVA